MVRHSNSVVSALRYIGLVPSCVLLEIFEFGIVQLIKFELVVRSRQHVLRLPHTPATSHVRPNAHASIVLPPLNVMHLDIFKLSWPLLDPGWSSLVIRDRLVVQRISCSSLVL